MAPRPGAAGGGDPRVEARLVDDAEARALLGESTGALAAPGFPREEDAWSLRRRADGALCYVIEVDGLAVGTCGTVAAPERGGEVEVGWGLVESARGRGVGSAAVAQMLEDLARRHPATALVARTAWVDGPAGPRPDGPASERILEREGFTPGPPPPGAGWREWRRPARADA